MTEKDYCDHETCVALKELGFPTKMTFVSEFGSIEIFINQGLIHLYEAQSWLRSKEVYIYPVIDRYIVNDNVTWQCEVFVPYLRVYRVGKELSYEDALRAGIEEGIKILKEK